MICIVGVGDGVDVAVVGVGVANGVSNGVADGDGDGYFQYSKTPL